MFFLCLGILWPMEAIPAVLKHIGYALPFANPVLAIRNLLSKNVGFNDSSVHAALLVLAAWTLVSNGLCFWLLRDKNKYKNK